MLPVCFVQGDRLVTAAGTPPDAAQIAQIQEVAANKESPDQEKAAEYLTYLVDMGLIKKASRTANKPPEGNPQGGNTQPPPAQ